MELWEALSKRRRDIGMQFSDLEKESGLSISTLKKILGGYIAAPSYESVQAIAYAMKMSMADLDQMIVEGEPESKSMPSEKAMALARIYDTLDADGQDLLDHVAAYASSHKKVHAGFRAVPILGEAVLDGTVETHEAARKEQQDMAKVPTTIE